MTREESDFLIANPAPLRPESSNPNNWDQLLMRAGEYASPEENSHETATLMVRRMLYFVEARCFGEGDIKRLRVLINSGSFNEAINVAQEIYERRYLISPDFRDAPRALLDNLIPLAREMARLPTSAKLKEIKQLLRREGDMAWLFAPELVAERRLMRRQSWEYHLNNIVVKLGRGNLAWPKKERLEWEKENLETLLNTR